MHHYVLIKTGFEILLFERTVSGIIHILRCCLVHLLNWEGKVIYMCFVDNSRFFITALGLFGCSMLFLWGTGETVDEKVFLADN